MGFHYIYIIIYLRYFKIKIAFSGHPPFSDTQMLYFVYTKTSGFLLQGTSQVAHAGGTSSKMLHDWWVASNMYN